MLSQNKTAKASNSSQQDLFTWQIIKINPHCLSQHKATAVSSPCSLQLYFKKLFYVCHHQHKYSAGERCFAAFHCLFQGLSVQWEFMFELLSSSLFSPSPISPLHIIAKQSRGFKAIALIKSHKTLPTAE